MLLQLRMGKLLLLLGPLLLLLRVSSHLGLLSCHLGLLQSVALLGVPIVNAFAVPSVDAFGAVTGPLTSESGRAGVPTVDSVAAGAVGDEDSVPAKVVSSFSCS